MIRHVSIQKLYNLLIFFFESMLSYQKLCFSKMKVKVAHSCLTLCDPMDCIVHGILQARILEQVAFPFSRGSSQPRDRTQVSHIVDSLTAEPQGKPKNTGMGSLSLLQWIFPTQESNRGLLCCRQILYQLSYEGSPCFSKQGIKLNKDSEVRGSKAERQHQGVPNRQFCIKSRKERRLQPREN